MATLRVVLISSNNHTVYKLRKILNEYSVEKNIFYEMSVYSKLKIVLKKDMAGAILFIDDSVDGKSCIKIVEILHENDCYEKMILMTSNFDTAITGYKVEAFDVLTDPIAKIEVFKVLDHALKPTYEKDILDIHSKDGIHCIKAVDIIYVVANGKTTKIIMKDETLEVAKSISEIVCLLPKDYFFHCHKSYAINFRKLRRINGNNSIASAVMIDGTEIPISRRRRADFNLARENFLENNFNL